MKISVVTSFSKKGYEDYGKRCIETLSEFWPKEVTLYVISEDEIEIPESVKASREVYFFKLYEKSQRARDFHILYVNDPRARGKGENASNPKRNRHWKTGYSFRHDAYKFSKKVFAIELAAKHVGEGLLIWLDADTYTFTEIPVEFFSQLKPEDHGLAFLERKGYHSECGFVLYDLDKPHVMAFITKFADLYYTGEVFQLKEWHDSWVFDWLRERVPVAAYSMPHEDSSHPFNYSALGYYMDHMKGDRKYTGEPGTKKKNNVKWYKPKRLLYRRLPKRTD